MIYASLMREVFDIKTMTGFAKPEHVCSDFTHIGGLRYCIVYRILDVYWNIMLYLCGCKSSYPNILNKIRLFIEQLIRVILGILISYGTKRTKRT